MATTYKYKYILNNGTTQDTDLELAQGSYILKRSYEEISDTFAPDEATIRGTIIARGTDVSGEINVSTYSGSMPYSPTEGLAIYRDNSTNWYLDTSACGLIDSDFPYYTASLACIGNKSTGRNKAFIYDLSIQRILINIDYADTRDYNGTTYYRLNSLSGYYYADVAGTPTPERPYENATTSISNFCVGFMNFDGKSQTFGMMYAYTSPYIRVATSYYERPSIGRPFFSLQKNSATAESDTQITLCFPSITDTTEVHNEYIYENGDRIIRYKYDAVDRTGDYTVWLNKEAFLKQLANFGFAFRFDGKIYKPIVDGGVVTGYTDDLNNDSEWDNWKNIGDHAFPSSPTGGGTKTDGIDDMALDFSGLVNGYTTYYLTSSTALNALVQQMSDQNDYPNLIGNIVSVKSYSADIESMIPSKSAESIQVGQFQSTVASEAINAVNFVKSLGSFKVDGEYGNLNKPHFLDYAPYTTLEVYIPFCGSIPLPSEVMYNTIQIYILSDVISGSCTGVVKCNGNIVATKSGMLGTSVLINANDSASQENAYLQSTMSIIGQGISGNYSTAQGVAQGLSACSQSVRTLNDNYTKSIGCMGDKSAYAMPRHAYLKRWRCIDKSDAGFEKSFGRPVCETKTLTAGMGFTQISKPRINTSLTAQENAEIIALLESGVIL